MGCLHRMNCIIRGYLKGSSIQHFVALYAPSCHLDENTKGFVQKDSSGQGRASYGGGLSYSAPISLLRPHHSFQAPGWTGTSVPFSSSSKGPRPVTQARSRMIQQFTFLLASRDHIAGFFCGVETFFLLFSKLVLLVVSPTASDGGTGTKHVKGSPDEVQARWAIIIMHASHRAEEILTVDSKPFSVELLQTGMTCSAGFVPYTTHQTSIIPRITRSVDSPFFLSMLIFSGQPESAPLHPLDTV